MVCTHIVVVCDISVCMCVYSNIIFIILEIIINVRTEYMPIIDSKVACTCIEVLFGL